MKNFINKELKISSLSLLMIMIFLILGELYLLNTFYAKALKKEYIDCVGSVYYKAINKYPDLKNELLPLVTRKQSANLSKAEYQNLREYGLSTSSANNIFPFIKYQYKYIYGSVAGLIMLVFILLFFLNYFQYTVVFKKIREITIAAMDVTNGVYDMEIKVCDKNEGDFSKLADSFLLMKDVIKGNLQDLEKGKKFLVQVLQGITHQLKTPIACLIFYNDILNGKNLDEDKKQFFLANSKKQLNRIEWLITKILELAKVDAGVIKLAFVNQSLKKTIIDTIESLDVLAKEKGVSVILENDNEIFANHDRHWLKEALTNIIKNGIEHTTEGGNVLVTLSENQSYFQITIKDDGEGIKKEDIPYIFNRFYRVKTTKKKDTAGIGLALTKSIVELHNGDIIVESEAGKGTKFTISFLNEYFKYL